MEQHLPNLYGDRIIIIKNAAMAFYNGKVQLYLETDALDISLGTSFLHVRDRMQFLRNKGPDNAALQPIACMSKNLSSGRNPLKQHRNGKLLVYSMA